MQARIRKCCGRVTSIVTSAVVRATFGEGGKTWIIGQYTHRGTVTAAPDWGRPHANVALLPALPDSYEGRLHDLHSRSGSACTDLWTFTTAPLRTAMASGSAMSDSEPVAEGVLAAAAAAPGLDAAAPPLVLEGLSQLLSGPARLQRWVGVSYKPETELQSHYGEMRLAGCYDQIVFADETSALAPIAPRPQPRADGGGGGGVILSRSSTQRLLKELQRIQRAPPTGIEARPLESDLLEWHFVIRCSQEPYAGGEYHGRLSFPVEYPMLPPSFRMLTPSGRFDPGARLCLSMSDYHPESWNPGWSVETLLVGLQSFMVRCKGG